MAVIAIHGGIIWTCFSRRQNFVKTSSVPPSKYRGGGSTLAWVRQNTVEHLCKGCKAADYLCKVQKNFEGGLLVCEAHWCLGASPPPPRCYSRTTEIPSAGFQAPYSKQWSSSHWVCWTWSKIHHIYFSHIIWKVLYELCCHNHLAHDLSFWHKNEFYVCLHLMLTPGLSGGPIMVYVLPAPVCPYAMMHTL